MLAEDVRLEAIIIRCGIAWGKLKKTSSCADVKHVSLGTCGKVFNAFVPSALLYGSETWAPDAPDSQPLRMEAHCDSTWGFYSSDSPLSPPRG